MAQYLIESHFPDAVTKSHTTKIVAGSYCTEMSVICVKTQSFVIVDGCAAGLEGYNLIGVMCGWTFTFYLDIPLL